MGRHQMGGRPYPAVILGLALLVAACSSGDPASVRTSSSGLAVTTTNGPATATDDRPVLLLQREVTEGVSEFALVRAGDQPDDGLILGEFREVQELVETDDGIILSFSDARSSGPTSGATVLVVDRDLTNARVLDERPALDSYDIESGMLVDCGMWVCRAPVLATPDGVENLTKLRNSSYRYLEGPLVAWEESSEGVEVRITDLESGDQIEGQSPVVPFHAGFTPYAVVPLPAPNRVQVLDIRSGETTDPFPASRVTPRQFEDGLLLFYSSCTEVGCPPGSHVVDLRGDTPEITVGPDRFWPTVFIDETLIGTRDGEVVALDVSTGTEQVLLSDPGRERRSGWSVASLGDDGRIVAWSSGSPTTAVATGNPTALTPIEISVPEYEGWLTDVDGDLFLGTRQADGFTVDLVADGEVSPVWGPAQEIRMVGAHPDVGPIVYIRENDGSGRLETVDGTSIPVGEQQICQRGVVIDEDSMLFQVSDDQDQGCARFESLSLIRVDFSDLAATGFAEGWDLPSIFWWNTSFRVLERWPPLLFDDWPEEPWEPFRPGHPYQETWVPDLVD